MPVGTVEKQRQHWTEYPDWLANLVVQFCLLLFIAACWLGPIYGTSWNEVWTSPFRLFPVFGSIFFIIGEGIFLNEL
jgi:hypothetical protein